MDPSFLESLPEAHEDLLDDVLFEFFKAVSEATGTASINVAAGVALNRLTRVEA